ncbi:MAG TPA: CAP domain-containing protein [Solirubrobacteraceae bacterium]|jgi:uncharacterized protein YkwD
MGVTLGVFVGPAQARTAAAPAANTLRASIKTIALAKPRLCAGSNLIPTTTDAEAIDAATLCLINNLRAAYSLGAVRVNRELQDVATTQVDDMVGWNYFADDRPPAQTPASLIASTRYTARTANISTGQNIGWGTGPYATPAQMVAAWMASPPHREIILIGEYTAAGVGVAPAVPSVLEQALPGATYAIEFASPN